MSSIIATDKFIFVKEEEKCEVSIKGGLILNAGNTGIIETKIVAIRPNSDNITVDDTAYIVAKTLDEFPVYMSGKNRYFVVPVEKIAGYFKQTDDETSSKEIK